ncbi:VWA domain-containing protein [Burkholderia sp. Ac-20365]|uniref:VWA domain-containing protein n=1 Tax=Burkholderia sp. Ac-20365 TaxID=2703897 RepID=UPI00197C8AFC|nr:VWA domain-containing protein [Burkholderia sp. Ac-20365]MBN3761329.1 VWA domain-containing protein [Burkholderia sp. Ac-20365]
MALQLNLEKSRQALVLNLEKAGVKTIPEMEVGLAVDVSESFKKLHLAGVTNALIARLTAWGLTFDPDGKLDCMTFSDGPENVVYVGEITADNFSDFVATKIIGKVKGWCGATHYHYFVNRMLEHFGWRKTVEKAGFLGRLFGQQDREVDSGPKRRSLIIALTDGDNTDHAATIEALRQSQERKDHVYFLFIGVRNEGSTFPFLESIGDTFSNTGFAHIDDLKTFVNLSDEEINAQLISDELIEWLKA